MTDQLKTSDFLATAQLMSNCTASKSARDNVKFYVSDDTIAEIDPELHAELKTRADWWPGVVWYIKRGSIEAA